MSIGKLREFNLSSGTWSTYIDRVEQYFLANDVKVNLRVPTLLAGVGDATYDLMVDLCSPKKPGQMEFNELVHLVKKHVQPTPSILAERYKFRKRTQAQSETVAQFAAALKHLARECEFKENLEENLRDQFVCGLRSESTRQRLFCDDNVTFSSAFRKAVALEAAANDAAAVEQRTTEGAVHAVHAQVSPAAAAGERAGPWRRNEGSGSRASSSGGFNNNNRRRITPCTCWASEEHNRLECRYQDYTCRVCLRPGHIQRTCPRVGRRAEGQVLRLDTARQVDELQRSDDSDGERESLAVDYDDEGVGGASGLYMVLTGGDPIVAEVMVANRRLAMHIDTGSAISCISDEMYAELFPEYELQANDIQLKSYDGGDIKCIGYITVPVKYGSISENLKLFIIVKGAVPLLGREWFKKLCMSVTVSETVFSNDKGKICNKFDINLFSSKYPEGFSGKLGRLRSQRATLRVRAGPLPVFRRARPLPLALRADVDAELQRMDAAGIVESVPSSDWASCLIIVLKTNGSLRICGDYKSTLNPMLEIDKYPLPIFEVLFNGLIRWATLLSGFKFKESEREMLDYWRRRRDKLYVENRCRMWVCRVVVPCAPRPAVLAERHGSHLEIVKCKRLARSFVFWPGQDDELERMCAACRKCGNEADLPPKVPVLPWLLRVGGEEICTRSSLRMACKGRGIQINCVLVPRGGLVETRLSD